MVLATSELFIIDAIYTMQAIRIYTILLTLVLLMTARTSVHGLDLSRFPLVPTFELAPEVVSEPIPLRWSGGWVLVKVKINGVDAGWFKIGTGWNDSGIDPTVADRLKLPEISEFGLLNQSKPSGTPRTFRVDSMECGQAKAGDVILREHDFKAMSKGTVESYGTGISGVIGWDLLRTLPFLLDVPALQLVWQRDAKPADGAVRIPMTEKFGCPFVEATFGDGFKALAMVNTAGVSVCVQRPFLMRHAAQLWQGPVSAGTAVFNGPQGDDDGLPVDDIVRNMPSYRWLMVGCGGSQEMHAVTLNPINKLDRGEVQIGYSVLRRRVVLFDGPGKAMWVKSAATVPEITLIRQTAPAPSDELLISALQSAIDSNDPVAVRALGAAGVDLKAEYVLSGACSFGSREAAVALIEAGAPVNPPPGQFEPPLMSACKSGNSDLIEMLLAKGADANRSNHLGCTPLEVSARYGFTAMTELLLGKTKLPKDPSFSARIMGDALTGGNLVMAKKMLARIPEKLRTQLDWTSILGQAVSVGQPDSVEWILKTGKPKLVTPPDRLPLLHAAIQPTRIEKSDAIREKLVFILLAGGADPNVSFKGVTPLLLAARHGNAAIVRQLLEAGAKATAKDYKQRNALQRAADANQPAELIALLLKRGLDLEASDSEAEITALGEYARHGNHEACRVLLEAGADPDGGSMFSPPPLGYATNSSYSIYEDALAVVQLLLKHGAKAGMSGTQQDFPGPLFGASMNGRTPLIKPLVKAGAPLESTFASVTPLGWACVTPFSETVSALLELGANPRVMDRNGITPLCHAAAAGRAENMKLLLDRGVSPDATDPLGVPPIWVAASSGQTRAVRLLLAAGAKPDAIHPTHKTTALVAARGRNDRAIVSLLEADVGVKK